MSRISEIRRRAVKPDQAYSSSKVNVSPFGLVPATCRRVEDEVVVLKGLQRSFTPKWLANASDCTYPRVNPSRTPFVSNGATVALWVTVFVALIGSIDCSSSKNRGVMR